MTVTEKVIAARAGVLDVRPDDFVLVDVDLACVDDVQIGIFEPAFRELGGRVHDLEKVVLIADHYSPPSGIAEATSVSLMHRLGKEYGIRVMQRAGIKHQVFIEQHMVGPGDLMVATDSHTNTSGAVGALAISLGPTDVAAVFATGKTWLRVPATIKLELEGSLQPGVLPMDVGLTLLGRYGREYARYKAIEWSGEAVGRMTLSHRMTLCNLTTEFGAKNGIIVADAAVDEYVAGVPRTPRTFVSDTDAEYFAVHRHDAGEFEPVVAAPSSPANVHPVSAFAGTHIDQAYLGSCTHGTLADLHDAAAILRDRRVAATVQLIVTPATYLVYEQALKDGTIATLVHAGATICTPGCGSCPGMHQGTLAEGEVRISTQNRNFVGRSGHPGSEVYLASPITVAAAALAGQIVHPAEAMR